MGIARVRLTVVEGRSFEDVVENGVVLFSSSRPRPTTAGEPLADRVRKRRLRAARGAPILLDGPTLVVRGHRVTHLRDTVRRP
jgi:hypothetical protein